MTELTIGKLAAAAGVNIETVRYYQRRGLLDLPEKPQAGYRRYSLRQINRLRFIKRAQGLGFTLSEVAELLLPDTGCLCTDTRALAARKLTLIEQRMADLAEMQKVLAKLIECCDAGGGGEACPIIDVLTTT